MLLRHKAFGRVQVHSERVKITVVDAYNLRESRINRDDMTLAPRESARFISASLATSTRGSI